MNNKELAKEQQLHFLQGREYERRLGEAKFTRKYILAAGRNIVVQFPKYKKPDDGQGYDDAFNAGYNAAIEKIGRIVLDAFSTPTTPKKPRAVGKPKTRK